MANSTKTDEIKHTVLKTAWCPGCGNFGILTALNRVMKEMNLEPWQILLVSGIGQAGKLPQYARGNAFNSLHGRPIPPAIGAKIVNHDLHVIAVSGDGDAYGEGGNHWMHAMRRNHDITYMVHDNQVYGLTKGQASPTSDKGYITKTTPFGAPPPVNPVLLAIAAGATFVARSFSADTIHLVNTIKAGIMHKGFALIDIFQPCVSFNHVNTYSWYRDRIYKLDEEPGYDPADRQAAFAKASEWGDRIPVGVIFKREGVPSFEEQIPALKKGTLINQSFDPARVKKLFDDFR